MFIILAIFSLKSLDYSKKMPTFASLFQGKSAHN